MEIPDTPQHSISIQDFGPLREIENFPIRNLVCIIGEQSVGKSTLAKLIYYCRDIRNEFSGLLAQGSRVGYEDVTSFHRTLGRRLRSKFFNIYGLIEQYSAFTVTYHYSPEHWVVLQKTSDDGQLEIHFSPVLKESMDSVIAEAAKSATGDAAQPLGLIRHGIRPGEGQSDFKALEERIAQELFYDDFHLIYVPAGRGLMSRRLFVGYLAQSTLSSASFGERESFDVVDALTRIYFDYIRTIRESWERLQGAISVMDQEQFFDAFQLRDLLAAILKGEYRSIGGDEYIATSVGKEIPIAFTSSGQQELLWISNILLYLTFTHDKCFIVIEEPEAHLFTKGQSELVNALAMFMNITGSQLFLTTHSPYIIIALSNLLYAGTLAETDAVDEVAEIIPKMQHLQMHQTCGMLISNGKLIDILDTRVSSIDVARLDYVSEYLADIFEELLVVGRRGPCHE